MLLKYKHTGKNHRLSVVPEDDLDRQMIPEFFPTERQLKDGSITIPYSLASMRYTAALLGDHLKMSRDPMITALVLFDGQEETQRAESQAAWDDIVRPFIDDNVVADLPDDFMVIGKPHPHQQVSLAYMHQLLGIRDTHALFFEQGTGKTYTALQWMDFLVEEGLVQKILIIAPKYTLYNAWGKDINWSTGLTWKVIAEESQYKKYEKIEAKMASQATIHLVNLETVNLHTKENLLHNGYDMVVIDESWLIKNPRAIRYMNAYDISRRSPYRLILNGTPMPNGPIDLWSQFHWLDDGIAMDKDYYDFRDKVKWSPSKGVWIDRKDADDNVQQMIGPFVLAFKKKEILCLPPRSHHLMLLDMSSIQRRHYDEFMREGYTEIEGQEVSYEYIVTKSLRARQIMAGFVPWKDEEVNKIQPPVRIPNAKYDFLKEHLQTLMEDPENYVLIWITFKEDIPRMTTRLQELKLSFCICNGDNSKHINKNLDDFNEGKYRVMIAHPASIGAGVNIQRANKTILFSYSENYTHFSQLLDRNHRADSERPVDVYYYCFRDSYEEDILKRLKKKEARSNLIVHKFRAGDLRWRNIREEWNVIDHEDK